MNVFRHSYVTLLTYINLKAWLFSILTFNSMIVMFRHLFVVWKLNLKDVIPVLMGFDLDGVRRIISDRLIDVVAAQVNLAKPPDTLHVKKKFQLKLQKGLNYFYNIASWIKLQVINIIFFNWCNLLFRSY